MELLWHHFISVDYNNNLLPKNVPDPGVIVPGAEILCKLYGFFCPMHAAIFPNEFPYLKHY